MAATILGAEQYNFALSQLATHVKNRNFDALASTVSDAGAIGVSLLQAVAQAAFV